jgi:hypothetical protein
VSAHSPFQAAVVTTVQELAADAVSRGAVTVSVLPETDGNIRVELQPANAEACPVSLSVGEKETDSVEIFPGDCGAVFELWPKLTDKLLALRPIVGAIIAGRYEEWLEPGSDPPKVVATAHTPEGPETTSRNVVRARAGEGWLHKQYEPY